MKCNELTDRNTSAVPGSFASLDQWGRRAEDSSLRAPAEQQKGLPLAGSLGINAEGLKGGGWGWGWNIWKVVQWSQQRARTVAVSTDGEAHVSCYLRFPLHWQQSGHRNAFNYGMMLIL